MSASLPTWTCHRCGVAVPLRGRNRVLHVESDTGVLAFTGPEAPLHRCIGLSVEDERGLLADVHHYFEQLGQVDGLE